MLIGMLWYGPLFGNIWLRALGKKASEMKGTGSIYGFSFLSALLMAFILSQFITMTGMKTIEGGMMIGVWAWLGFVATTHVLPSLYEKRSWTLYMLNIGYILAVLLSMGAIIQII